MAEYELNDQGLVAICFHFAQTSKKIRERSADGKELLSYFTFNLPVEIGHKACSVGYGVFFSMPIRCGEANPCWDRKSSS